MDDDRGVAAWVSEATDRSDVRLERLPAEASTRRFYRVYFRGGASWHGAATLVAMVSPPATEDNDRFVRFAALFRRHGLATPRIHQADLGRGLLLLEDLGVQDFATAYAAGEVDAPLAAAGRALVALQRVPGDEVPVYAPERFADELAIHTDWLIERFSGLRTPGWFGALRDALIDATQAVPQRVVHRDYHCRNLIWRRASGTHGRVGIVDFQDALVGPACYDLASLLRDCYWEFDERTVVAHRNRFLAQAGLDCDEAVFARAFDLTAIQRQLKATGIFARLYLARGRRSHLRDIAPVLERIARLARDYAATECLAAWLEDEMLPAVVRRLEALQ